MTYLGLDEGRLLAVVDGLNQIAGSLPDAEDVAETGASVAMSLAAATGATVTFRGPDRRRSFEAGDPASGGSEITIQIENRGEQVGSISVVKRTDDGFGEPEVEALRLLAQGLGAQIDHAVRYEAAVNESRVDPLTGLGNRLAFDERLEWELSRTTRYAEHLSLCLFEIDDQPSLEARLGSDEMDRLVVELAEVLSRGRSADSCFRISSDSFAVVMPNTSESGAEIAAIRMAWQVALLRGGGVVTVTPGVAESEVPDVRVLLAAAVRALRAARVPTSA